MLKHLGSHRALLHYAAVLRDIAEEDGESAGLGERLVHRSDSVMVDNSLSLDVLADGLSVCSDQRLVDKTFLVKFRHNCRDSARSVEIVHVRFACRGQMAEVRRLLGYLVEEVEIEGHSRFMGYGQKMEHRIRGASQCHIACKSVSHRLFGDYVSGFDILCNEVHDRHSGVLGQHYPLVGYCGDGPVSGKSDTYRLAEAVHAVCRIHSGAGSAARADVLFELPEALIIDDPGLSGSDRFEHLGKRYLFPVHDPAHHGAAGTYHCRDIDPESPDQHSRDDLIAVGNQYEPVELMSYRHGLHGVRYEFSAGE